jgi:hypothetical protein
MVTGRAGRRVLGALGWPAGLAVAALMAAIMRSPRRVPDLGRFTRGAEFGQLQSAAAAWADRNFELIEAGAPWLDRVGCRVLDRCETGLVTHPLSIPRDPPSVTCSREITVVYGVDGSLGRRLAELAAVLGAAGWGERQADTTVPLRDLDRREPPEWSVDWSAVAGFRLPALLETMPPVRRFPLKRWLDMGIGWVSRGQPADLVTTTAGGRPGDPRAATATYQPVEIGGAEVTGLASQALARHQHAIGIRIQICYYLNANVNARPGRLRKRLLPVRPLPARQTITCGHR